MSTSQQILLGNAPTGGYQIERSLRFNSADSAYLNRTPASASNRKTWTWSGWVKRSTLGSVQAIFSCGTNGATYHDMYINSDDTLRVVADISGTPLKYTTQVFRDVGAWYHFVNVFDTTNATAGDRWRLYVNGVRITAFGTSTDPSLNADGLINSNSYSHAIGQRVFSGSNYLGGYLTEVNFIDGQALDPTSFGETNPTTGVWQPKAYTGSYGTNGFYLNFSDNASTTTLGDDLSGNGNDWTTNNFSVTAGAGNDSLVDTPTPYGTDTGAGGEVRGNYATLNPLDKGSSATITDGNLRGSASSDYFGIRSTVAIPSTGKWYFEATVNTVSGNVQDQGVGLLGSAAALSTTYASSPTIFYIGSGGIYSNGSSITSGLTAFSAGSVLGVAVDADAGTVQFYVNNTAQSTAKTLPSNTGTWHAGGYWATSRYADFNFGQRPFAYTAPSGFKALVTTNLPTPTVVQGDDYFNTILYTGTGSSNARTGVGFQPDLVWIKERNASADHALYDAVRGVQQQLESNTTTDETTESTGLTAFGSDGFTVGSLAQVNTNNDTYVAWCWKESTTSKFDIVTYTGNGTARTISHNLGVVPNMIIVKARTTASTDQGWPVYHSANTANPETDYLLLNTTAATADLDTVWNDTAPTSSVFSVGTNALVNANNDTYVAYLFANVAGYSAFGSYTGNGSADGPFVYTGFRPKFILFKRTDTTSNWQLQDSARNTFNVVNINLNPNLSDAESVAAATISDFLSSGFKLRGNGAAINASGGTYIYAAFAENPFKYSLAR